MKVRNINIEEIERMTEAYDGKKTEKAKVIGIIFCVIILLGYLYLRLFHTEFGCHDDAIYVNYSTAWVVKYPAEYQGERITKIHNYGVEDKCPNVKFVYVEDGIEEIGQVNWGNTQSGFRQSDLWAVRLPDSVTEIGDYAFDKCRFLTVLWFDGAQDGTVIGEYAFSGTNLRQMNIPEGVTSIGKGAFWESNVKTVTMPDSVTRIGEYAFQKCNRLERVTLSKQLDILPANTFRDCGKLKILENTENLKYVAVGALEDTQIKEADVSKESLFFAAYGDEIANDAGCYAYEETDAYEIDLSTEPFGEYSGYFYDMDRENAYMSEKTGIPLEVFEEPKDSERIWIDGKYYTMDMSLEKFMQNDSWEIVEGEKWIRLYNQRTGNSLEILTNSEGEILELVARDLEIGQDEDDNICQIVLPGGISSDSMNWMRAFLLYDSRYERAMYGYKVPHAYDLKLAGEKYYIFFYINDERETEGVSITLASYEDGK